jgi:hypothetical protein
MILYCFVTLKSLFRVTFERTVYSWGVTGFEMGFCVLVFVIIAAYLTFEFEIVEI